MKCLNCQKTIEHEMPCIFCKNIFCSYKCLRSHIIYTHNNNLLINTSNLTSKNSQKKITKSSFENNNIIKSPYLIEGIYYKQRNYDEKYNLDNFMPVFYEGKPKIIGGGSFGQVFLVTNTKNKKLYAIKHMIKRNLSKKLNSLESIYKEIYIQSRIDHPNILPILYVKETTNDFDLVLEYAKGGSLFHFIRRRRYLDENMAFSLFIQVVNAVYFLHKNDLIHRDIKPENILLFENNVIKLCDFGWCVKLEAGQQRGTFCGTTEYMSPELVNHEEYSKEIDIWSLGVLLYEMVHGYSPFRPDKPNFNARDVIHNIRMHNLKFNKSISQRCKDLIYHLLDEEADKRYKVEDIFSSDFVKYYESKSVSFPDKYLIEKYKFKIAKSQNRLYPTVGYSIGNYKRRNISHNKSSSNIINHRNNFFEENNLDKEFDDNISNIEKNVTINKNIRKKKYPSCLSDANLEHLINNKNKNVKSSDKKIEKNKSFEYFPSFTIIDNKINISLLGNSKSNRQIQYLKKPYNINKTNKNICNNELKNIKEEEIPKNETKIKTIIINNYFPNMVQNNEFKKTNDESKEIAQKKNFHIKPLKMSKIPTSNKNSKININLSKKKLNSFIKFNYLMIKKHLSPKLKLLNENKKINNISREKTINDNNDSKIIEVNRTNYLHSSKITYDIPYQFNIKANENKRIYTRNVSNNYKYDSMKNNNHYYSRDNHSKLDINNLNNNIKNNSFANFHFINDGNNYSQKKTKEEKIHHTKSMNLLNINFKNENISSILSSNVTTNTNNISINSENKSIHKSKYNNNRIQENNHNLNFCEIRKVNTNIYKTKQNSPLNTFNNNFVHTILNRRKIIDNKKRKENISLSNNISTLNIYDFNSIKKSNKQNNVLYKLEKNKENKYQMPAKKLSKKEIINTTFNEIKRNNKQNDINKKIIDNNKKIYNIPKLKTFKKNNALKIDINTSKIQKNCHLDNCICNICNSQNYINNQKYLVNKNILKCYTRNNSNKAINNEKIKFIERLELNNLLNNKNKIINNKIIKENSFTNSGNKKSESFINNKNYNVNGKQENEKSMTSGNYRNFGMMNKYTSSRNYKNCQDIDNLKTTNNHENIKIIHSTTFHNIGNKIKNLNKKEPKVVLTTTIPRCKKGINRIINDENDMNKLNFTNKNKYKRGYNGILYKIENNSFLDKKDDIYCKCHN